MIDFANVLKRVAFYSIFYTSLVFYFGFMMFLYQRTIDLQKPRSTHMIKQPGLQAIGYYSLVTTDPEFPQDWDAIITEYFDNSCDHRFGVCRVENDIEQFSPCFKAEDSKGRRKWRRDCVLLKLNKVYDWIPDYYNATNLPETMPNELRTHITDLKTPEELNTLWISCEGLTEADRLTFGNIEYLPRRGFSSHHFPYKNERGQKSPVIALLLQEAKEGSLIQLECRAWAGNIEQDRHQGLGVASVTIYLPRGLD